MSKSYHNAIFISDNSEEVDKKIKPMMTDPARKRRNDSGDPRKCPVYDLHRVFSSSEEQIWASKGCKSASIGCLDCKAVLIGNVNRSLDPIREKRAGLLQEPERVKHILEEGAGRAREVAQETMADVRAAMKL